jgi:hypothetical protein
MSEDDLFVKLPPFRRTRVHQRFSSLMRLFELSPSVPTAEQVARAIGLDKPLAVSAVGPSLSDLTKGYASAIVRRKCAYRLAANADRLAAGWACPAGDYAAGELCAARVTGIEVVLDAGGSRHRHNIGYRVLSGRAAGSQVVDSCQANVIRAIYGQLTGWPRGCHPYSATLMVGLELALTLKRDMGLLTADKLGVTRSQRARNVQLTRKRFREHHDCPVGFGLDCSNCMVGMSECRLSVLPIDTNLLTQNV